MATSPLPDRLMDGLRQAFSRLVDFIGRIESGRLVLLCILLIVAANIADDIFDFGRQRKKAPLIVVEQTQRAPAPSQAPSGTPAPENSNDDDAADAPVPPSAPVPAPPEREVRLRIGGEGIVISDGKDLGTLGKRIERQIEKELERANVHEPWVRVSLPQLALLCIVLLIIVRIVARSKAQAEARAVHAESAADSAALERQLAEAKLQAMQAQVEPHFLFNTLAAVEHLIETDPPRAASMQRNLIAYLRSVLPNLRRRQSTLGREIEISRNYLEILKVRMEHRLDFGIDLPPGLESASMPPLMLQSLVENAIEHGLEPKTAGGRIDIRATVRDGQLVVTVADTGVGFAPKAGAGAGAGGSRRGVGLASIRERLAALFDGRARLSIEPNLPEGTRATIDLPYAYQADEPAPDSPDRR